MVLYIGNAHEETARQRSKGRSMAKFIHYYTRYKAHGESALLESRYIQTGFDLTAMSAHILNIDVFINTTHVVFVVLQTTL